MSASLSVADVAALVGGSLVGDGSVQISGVAPLDRAGPADISFLSGGRYLPQFRDSRAGAVLCIEEHRGAPGPGTRIVVSDPHRAMLEVVRRLRPEAPREVAVHATASVGRGAVIGADVFLGPHVVVGAGARLGERVTLMAGTVVGDGVVLGDDVTAHPNVTCYPGTIVGSRVILHAGVRLGVDGFGYVPGPGGHAKIPHVGRCVVEDDVEIGANTTVDRGSVDDTVIGAGTKIDNLVQVAHNVRIGRGCLIMAQVGIAGSTRVGDGAILAGQAGIAGHITIGARARVGAQGGVIGDIEEGATVSGYPARSHRDVLRAASALHRLARIVGDLERLVKRDGA